MRKSLADFVRAGRAHIKEISPEELDEMIENHEDLLVVDVREPNEYVQGHIPGALHVPRGTLEATADPTFRKCIEPLCNALMRTVVLYCQSGTRGALATDTLQAMGFEKVRNLAGGFERWQAEGFAVVRD